jgi:chloride channel protein, CIC family
MNLSSQTKEILFLLLAIIIGVLAGAGTLAFLAYVKAGQWVVWQGPGELMDRVLATPWWLRILIPTLGGLAVGPLIAFWAPEARGPGVPEVMESAALKEGHISPRTALLKAGATGLTIFTGGSVGREGPVVGIGAAIGSFLTRMFSFSAGKGRICLACGVAGAFAATFATPIAGALFTIEVILADLEMVYLGHIVIAAIVAELVVSRFGSGFPEFMVQRFGFHNSWELLVYLVLGLVAGLVAIAFTRAVYATDGWFRRLPLPEWLKPALGGLGLGALAVVSPHILGVGYDSINLSLAGKFALAAAAFLILTKFVATVLCLGSGMSGGIMGPSFFMGAMLGTTLALVSNHFFPGLNLHPTDYALVGMGALVSGTTLGPITATVIIFELSNNSAIIVPGMVSCIASFMVVKSLYGYSTYETKLLRRGVKIFLGREVHLLRSMKVKDYMSREMEILRDDTPLPEILRRAEHSAYPFFVVVDEKSELTGVMTLYDLRMELDPERETSDTVTAKDLKTAEVYCVHPEDDFETVFALLEHKDISFVPVVLPPRDKVVVGIVRIENLLTSYNHQLLKGRVLRYPVPEVGKKESPPWKK